jgi:hypothetical protein
VGLIPWKPGRSGNPAGRQKGSRNKLSQDFIEEAYAAWKAHGKDAFEHMATKEPSKFVQTIAALIPQHFKFEHEHSVVNLTEEQIEERIIELSAALGLGNGARAPKLIGGNGTSGGAR